MMNSDGRFTKAKRWLIGSSGILVAWCSILLTRQGVGLSGDFIWMGTVIAFALFCAELMFNSNFDELNWTILILGLGAYLYSIWTNVEGLYFYRAIEGNLWTNFDFTNFGGGVFMDVYPELAIAWAMKESKIGDLLGNIFKTAQDPDKLTQTLRSTPALQKPQQSNTVSNQQNTRKEPPHNLPRREQPVNYPQKRGEPTYHQISQQNSDLKAEIEQEIPAFLQNRQEHGKVQR